MTGPETVDHVGWGGTAPSRATVLRPREVAGVQEVLEAARAGGRHVLARGLGRSYGDSAQRGGGLVVDTANLGGIGQPGPEMDLGAGVSLDALMRTAVPQGWFVPVTPGTRFVSVAGAIASDIHGKNHHRDGTFGRHVDSVDLVLASGELVSVTPNRDEELFWATVGGMGLTGVIVGARVRMRPIETSQMLVDTTRVGSLDDLLGAMSAADETATYSVAWVDTLARGRQLGRSVLTTGEHAPTDALSGRMRDSPLRFAPRQLARAPRGIPNAALNRASVAAFNEVWFRKAPQRRVGELQSIAAFFHPLDGVGEWRRIYGPRGFLQYQFVVPDRRTDVIESALTRFSATGCPVFLAVLKRMGPENASPLSFPMAGWTLALDIPTDVPGLASLLDSLDELVVQAGGRLYLTKDSRMHASLVPRMYPRLADFEAVRDRVDPDRRFGSDQSERLHL